MSKLTFNQLLHYNVHIGHGLKNTLLFSSWILYGKRQGLWIIDLKITLFMFKFSFKIIKLIIGRYSPFWFINLDKGMKQLIEYIAAQCGEFAIAGFWIRGLITNFLNVKAKIFLNKKIYLRYSWPRCVFISSAFFSSIVVKESSKAEIPCISIIDTNVKSYGINLVIPGNDDNLDCVLFYNWFYGNLILKEKFFQIILWYQKIIRKSKYNVVWRFFDNHNIYSNYNNIYLNNSIKYYSSFFIKRDIEISIIQKYNVSLVYLNNFLNNFLLFSYLKNYLSIYKSMIWKHLIFSKRRIKFFFKRFRKFNFKRLLYKNILRNKRYFIFIKYLLFLRIFLYNNKKKKLLTCNAIKFKYFNFFLYTYKLKYLKNSSKLNRSSKNLNKKSFLMLYFNSLKFSVVLNLWKNFDKRTDHLNLFKKYSILLMKFIFIKKIFINKIEYFLNFIFIKKNKYYLNKYLNILSKKKKNKEILNNYVKFI